MEGVCALKRVSAVVVAENQVSGKFVIQRVLVDLIGKVAN